MADKARQETDKQLRKMEKEIRKIYEQAQDEITQKWNAYMEKGQERLNELWQAYEDAPKGERRNAKQAYQDAVRSYTLQNEHYENMLKDVSDRLSRVNEIALNYTNDKLAGIYTINYNQKIEGITDSGLRFDIVDEHTVQRLIKDGDIQLPYKHLNRVKDRRWNTRRLNSAVLQGILQGESMHDIAERILPVVNNDANAAIRNARTMVTGAENRGRLDRYEDLQEQGAVIKKVWIATHDDRVREWHLDMDGQEVDLDEPFIDGNGNEIDYPADPSGAPETVYNCRCSMKSHVVGVRSASGKIRYFK